MAIYTVGGQFTVQSESDLITKLSQRMSELHNNDSDIDEQEALAIMGDSCRTAWRTFLDPSEATRLAQLFQRRFPHSFTPTLCPYLLSEPGSIKSRALDVINIVAGHGQLETIQMTEAVHHQLQATFTHEHETGFLLFADARTGIIAEAVQIPDGGKRSIIFNESLINALKMKMESRGYILVGKYHSHTRTQEEVVAHRKVRMEESAPYAREGFSRYAESLLSKADGHMQDGSEEMDQFQLVGSDGDGQGFVIRAFLRLLPRHATQFGVELSRLNPSNYVKHYHFMVGNRFHYELNIRIID